MPVWALPLKAACDSCCVGAAYIHGWWIWLYWGLPQSYAFRALVANELTAPRWQEPYQVGSFILLRSSLFITAGLRMQR